MMQAQLLEFSWQQYNPMDSYLDGACLDDLEMDDWELSSSVNVCEDSSDVSSRFPRVTSNDLFHHLPTLSDDMQFIFPVEQFTPSLEELDSVSNNQSVNDDILGWMDSSEESNPLQQHLIREECLSSSESLVLPREDMEVNNQLRISHLLKAYGEAMENKQTQLADVIISHIKDMVSPMGLTMERLAYYFIQDKQGDYLKQESIKNYEMAFGAFYKILPYGKFAHLTANLAILEAIPEEAEIVHIIDFDLGEGVQWSSLIEAIGPKRAMKLTSVKWKDNREFSPQWRFDETKTRLFNHAQSVGLKLEMAEMGMEELVNEMNKIGRQREWLAFNCMVGLPHMGRKRSTRHVMEFLMAAKELNNNSIKRNNMKSIIILGNGDGAEEGTRNFDRDLSKLHAMFESMESHFPCHLTNARITMECLFLEPYVSSLSCFPNEEEPAADICPLHLSGYGFEGSRFSSANIEQAKVIVNEGRNPYGLQVTVSTMSLQWRGTTLVTVSTWT